MPSNHAAPVKVTMRRGKVRRALAVLGVAALLQHWFSFVIPAMPSFVLRVAEISPYLQFLIPYLSNWGLVIGFVFVVLGACLLWATWGLRPELAGGKSANSVSPAQQDERHRPTLRRILSYVKPHWPYVAGILAAIVTAAALDLYQVWIVAFLFIGEVGYRGNIGILPSIITLLAMTFVVKEFASFLKDYLSEVLSQKTVHKLRSDLYEHVERQPMNVLDGSRSGELISRVVSDTGEVEKVLTDNFADLVTNAVMVAGATGLLFFVNAGLATIVVPLAVVMVVVVNRFKQVIKLAARRIREAIAELTARAFEVVSGLRIVKSFVMEGHEADAFRPVPRDCQGQSSFSAALRDLFHDRGLRDVVRAHGRRLVRGSHARLEDSPSPSHRGIPRLHGQDVQATRRVEQSQFHTSEGRGSRRPNL